jgi:VIT1/CCC1 family predicted Fe2+/Mn2+ transporter
VGPPGRLLDPLDRACEILFGVIMVVTFTGSISVAHNGAVDTRTVVEAAIGCNLAWGLVDAAMYLMTSFAERARRLAMFRGIRGSNEPDAASHRLIRDALPPVVSEVLTPVEVEALRQRLNSLPEPAAPVLATRDDVAAAAGVFLLVFLSTFPIVIPFFIVRDVNAALRASNAVAMLLLFAAGWSVGRYAGRAAWRTGMETVAVGIALVAITMALGG